MNRKKEHQQAGNSLICTSFSRPFEPHPFSSELCRYCFTNLTERRFAVNVRPLIIDGFFSESPTPYDHLHPRDRLYLIEKTKRVCSEAISEIVEGYIASFNEIATAWVKTRDQVGNKLDLDAELHRVIRSSTQEKSSDEKDLSRPGSVGWFVITMEVAIVQRRILRRYLHKRAGFDAIREKWINNKKGLNPHQFNCFMHAWREYSFHHQLFMCATIGACFFLAQGKKVRPNIEEVTGLMRQWFIDESFCWHIELSKSPHPNYEAATWVYLCSEVRKGIRRFPRLQTLLDNQTPGEFLSRVALSLLEIIGQGPLLPDAFRKQLVNRTTRQMTRENKVLLAKEKPPQSMAEQFALREEARIDIESLMRNAKLSQREGELLALRLEHPKATSTELGAMMNIKTGTIDSMEARTLKKLRKATHPK